MSRSVNDAEKTEYNLLHFLNEEKQRLSENDLFVIVEQVASKLSELHEKGASYGSLKLTNILVSRDNLLIQTSLAPARSLSASHLLDGSISQQALFEHLAFLAPEQKSAAAVDLKKADIYAFGVLVYFLIMGLYPEGFFPLPSHELKDYKFAWDHLIIQCLQPNPAKRPSSLREVLEQLSPKSTEETDTLKPCIKPAELVRPEFDEDPGAIFRREAHIGQFRPKPQEIKELNPLHTEMVIIRGGTFQRGSNNGGRDEMPRHAIVLNSYAIDVHPVTNEQFVRFLEAMGGEKDAQNCDIIRLRESRIKRLAGKLNIESGYGKHPVVGVTWYGAIAYAKWVGKRLPTEAEWEIAACAGKEEILYPTGPNIERSQANFFSSDTTPVMSYPPNGCGLYDMAGNVYEWCNDWYGYHYYDTSVQEPNNPQGPAQGVYRILRGGCWKSLKEDLRCSHRHRNNPGTMNGTYGFRCAADVQ